MMNETDESKARCDACGELVSQDDLRSTDAYGSEYVCTACAMDA